jgi:hypothetical protein
VATIEFEGSTLGDDLAAINAAVARLGVTIDVANPPPAIIVGV